MLARRSLLVVFVACAICAGEAIAAAPATQPSGAIEGTVTASGVIPVSEMVVYLESPDPKRAMPPTTQPGVFKISQKDAAFEPKLAIITAGQSVEFPNDETRQVEHNVFSDSTPKRFDLGLYGPGQSKTILFDQPGPVFIYCSVHRHMDGVIFVSPTPFATRVSEAGTFRIEGVPPGEWVVKTWQKRRRFPEVSLPISVTVNGVSNAAIVLKRTGGGQ